MDVLSYILLFAGMLVGLAIIPFGLPGVVVILICILTYAISTGFAGGVGWMLFIVLCMATLVAETADNWLTVIGARRYGASTGSMWLAMVGGIAGAVLIGGPLALVLGPLGPIAGGFAGAFLAAFLHERAQGKTTRESFRAGWGTFLGRMAGIVLKFVIAAAMIVAVAASILF